MDKEKVIRITLPKYEVDDYFYVRTKGEQYEVGMKESLLLRLLSHYVAYRQTELKILESERKKNG